jgi:hypothetical protein
MMESKTSGNFEISLIIDGKRVPTNFFVKEMLGGGVEGMVRALKGVDNPGKIELTVERSSESESGS